MSLARTNVFARTIGSITLAVVSTAALGSAHASAVFADMVRPTGIGLERGVASVKCAAGARVSRFTRGAVIAIAASDREVILTVAHGLPETLEEIPRKCRVLGRRGLPMEIEQVWKSEGSLPGTEDWAVLLTKRRIGGDVGRLHVGSVSPDLATRLAAAEAPVRLVLRYAPATEGDCRLHAQPFDATVPLLLAYSCISAPGSSGLPLTMGVDGDPVVIGIHLGWGIENALEPGHRSSVARLIDSTIVAALREAAASARPQISPDPRAK